jgi:hypothetical protein
MQFNGKPVKQLRVKRKDGFYKVIWDPSRDDEFINYIDLPSETINSPNPPAPGETRFRHCRQCKEYKIPLFLEI